MTRPRGSVCGHASIKYTEVPFVGSDTFPTKEVARGVQAAAADGGPTRDTALGLASLDSEGLYRVEYHGHSMVWLPGDAGSMKKRLLVCANLEGAGHRGVHATAVPRVGARQDPDAFHGRRLRSGGLSVQAGQAPQAQENLDRIGRVGNHDEDNTCTQCSTWSQPNCATSTWRDAILRR